ncbi:MAG: ATP-binding protein [Candidatus Njordarchaeales archaeon]
MFFHEDEQQSLEKIYNKDGADLVIIYGRRRLGKTTLVLKALEGKDGAYLYTPRGNIEDIVTYYLSSLRNQIDLQLVGKITEFREFLELLGVIAKNRKVLIILDEFQRIHEADEKAISLLQDYWDRVLKRTQIKLILVGSIVGLIEKLAIKGDAPLFGRKTLELKIRPLPFYRVHRFWNMLDFEEKITAYGIFGGTPAYIDMFNKKLSLWENVLQLIIRKDSPLNNEPDSLLSAEVRSSTTYMAILNKISEGRRGLPLGKIKVGNVNVIPYIRTLEKMDIIERLYSLGEKKKGALYVFKDEFFRFWFRFINKNYWLIEMERYDLVIDEIKKNINEYLSFTSEKILRELLILYSGKVLFGKRIPKFTKFGPFFERDVEVDALGVNKDIIVVGEIKWKNEKLGLKDISKVIEKTEYLAKKLKRKKYLTIIVSKSGFKQHYEEENILLIDLNMLQQAFGQ